MNAVTVHVSKIVTTLWEVSSVVVRLDIQLMVPDATVSREYKIPMSIESLTLQISMNVTPVTRVKTSVSTLMELMNVHAVTTQKL